MIEKTGEINNPFNRQLKTMHCLAAFLFLVSLMANAQAPQPVKVEQGLVQGVKENELTVYKGIPFATPPVGDLRWRAPKPALAWNGVRQATQFAPAPIQGGNPPSGKSEDCLYLNIWTYGLPRLHPMIEFLYLFGFMEAALVSDPILNLFTTERN
jgi:para-nitrobenzyl esterase